MLPLVYASLESLIDFCTGPCQENQKLLGNQRHLISFVNSFLNKEINFNSSNENDLQMIEIFSTIIKFLLALVNGNKDGQVKEFLLKQLNIDALIRKLVIIYTTKIANRDVNIFRQNRHCPGGFNGQHTNGCAENHCVTNFLTPKDVVITETSFNIYILLTIFTDEFPNNYKLEKFRFDKLSSEDKERLRDLEQKYKAEKQRKGQFSLSSNILMQYNTQYGHNQPHTRRSQFGQIHPGDEPKSNKIFKPTPTAYKGLLLNDDENSVMSPDNYGADSMSPLTPPETRKSSATISPAPNNSSSFRVNFVKQLAENVEKTTSVIDKDVQKMQEEETFKEFFTLKERSIMYKARKFFKIFINSVEVSRDEEISKNYFQVPFECDYMTENIRDHLIFRANRNSDVERLEHFFFNIPLYRAELEHRQNISRNTVLEWFIIHWKLFKDIAYISVFANNLIMLISYENDPNGESELGGADPDASKSMNLVRFSYVSSYNNLLT